MRYIYECDCGMTLYYSSANDLIAGVDLHHGSDQVHLSWEHEAQR
jgi:hypothetical protein